MALVTVQRTKSSNLDDNGILSAEIETFTDSGTGTSTEDEETTKTSSSASSRRLSECYFAGKGAAVSLPAHPHMRVTSPSSDIQRHLQSMFYLLRPEETLKMAVKLESVHLTRTRYLVVVSCDEGDECCLLGIDCNECTTVGLVLRVLADTTITLDGDGGFSVSICGRQHIFKPVSVQAMWSALQTLHKVSSKAREKNYFQNGGSHEWVNDYESKIESDRSCLNEWHAMDSIESRRPPSPDSLRHKPGQREETEKIIRSTLKEIMMSVDLDDVTSKYIRTRLEEQLDMDLGEYKPFIDEEMLVILGQMDAATQIFPHVYLGSEWNASNLEELTKNGVCHILNVTREIDNFFPGMFNYLNIRVYDNDTTDLLKHWDDTYKYITNAKNEGSKVLVHCKMGISRSASVVVAYAMKAYNWDLSKALAYVREKRNCIKPNSNFVSQLETYQGILDAMKNREKLQRSKSETNLKCNSSSIEANTNKLSRSNVETRSCSVTKEESPMTESPIESPCSRKEFNLLQMPSGTELTINGSRPKSWSPDALEVISLFESNSNVPTSQSLERLNSCEDVPCIPPAPPLPPAPKCYNVNVRMPCGNGLAYSVSQNKVLHLPCTQSPRTCEGGVKGRIYALEANVHGVSSKESNNNQPQEIKPFHQLHNQSDSSKDSSSVHQTSKQRKNDKKPRHGIVLNLTSQFEPISSQNIDTAPVLTISDNTNKQNLVKTKTNNTNSNNKEKGIKKYFKSILNHRDKNIQNTANTFIEADDNYNEQNIIKNTFENDENLIITKRKSLDSDRQHTHNTNLSRQSSWSSHDSAIVIDNNSNSSISRQNSWNSFDKNNTTTIPNIIKTPRTCSLGSYDVIHSEKPNPINTSESYTDLSRRDCNVCKNTVINKFKTNKCYNCFGGNRDDDYDKRKAAASNCINNVILRKKINSNNEHLGIHNKTQHIHSNVATTNENEKVNNSFLGFNYSKTVTSDKEKNTNQNDIINRKSNADTINKEGKSIFYVSNDEIQNRQLAKDTKEMSRNDDNISKQNQYLDNKIICSIPLQNKCFKTNTNISNEINNTIPPSNNRPLSQTLFNYSNSYPQPFSKNNTNKLKNNNHLSKSSPNIIIIPDKKMLSSLNIEDTHDANISSLTNRSSFCCNSSTSSSSSSSRSQDNNDSLSQSTQSLNLPIHQEPLQKTNNEHLEKYNIKNTKRSVSVEENKDNNNYGIVKNLKNEFEFKHNVLINNSKRNDSFNENEFDVTKPCDNIISTNNVIVGDTNENVNPKDSFNDNFLNNNENINFAMNDSYTTCLEDTNDNLLKKQNNENTMESFQNDMALKKSWSSGTSSSSSSYSSSSIGKTTPVLSNKTSSSNISSSILSNEQSLKDLPPTSLSTNKKHSTIKKNINKQKLNIKQTSSNKNNEEKSVKKIVGHFEQKEILTKNLGTSTDVSIKYIDIKTSPPPSNTSPTFILKNKLTSTLPLVVSVDNKNLANTGLSNQIVTDECLGSQHCNNENMIYYNA